MILEPRSKLLFIGDSITDCGRARPVGEGLGEALGRGYVSLVAGLLGATYPGHQIRVANVGSSGNTVRDLKNRWPSDVLALKPDYLAVMIGINDVWRQFDMPLQTENHVGIAEYEATLDELLKQTRPQLKGLIMMTPFYIESNAQDAMRLTMDRYGAATKNLAEKYQGTLVDTQAAFNAVLRHGHSAGLAWDRVHPGVTGHMVLARAFLSAVGYQW
jgi:lysophospholipase L1-like esterase